MVVSTRNPQQNTTPSHLTVGKPAIVLLLLRPPAAGIGRAPLAVRPLLGDDDLPAHRLEVVAEVRQHAQVLHHILHLLFVCFGVGCMDQ